GAEGDDDGSPLNPSCSTRLNRKLAPTWRDSASRIVSASRRNLGRAASIRRGDTPKVTTSPSTDRGCASWTALPVATGNSGSTGAHARMTSSTATDVAAASASRGSTDSVSLVAAGAGSDASTGASSAVSAGAGAASGRRLRSAPTVTPGARDAGSLAD